MTTVAVPAEQTQKRTKPPLVTRFYVWSRIRLGVLLIATAALYLWSLSASGWANAFYSAAARGETGNVLRTWARAELERR